MKIICDSCGTKYSISDDKVRGKVFKIRCKKCSHIIVVRGGEAASEASAAPASEGGWHIVVDGEQVGPIPDTDVRDRIERGEIKADTYAWKEGFADWMKLSAIPEFSGAFGGDSGATVDPFVAASPSNGAERAKRPSGAGQSLFSSSAGVDVETEAFAAPARGGGGDLFAAAAMPAAEPRWPSSGAAPAGHDGGRVENLTGQRHENSVLFSLSNLQSLAMPSAKPAPSVSTTAPTPDGSGLIDIRAMAASTGMGLGSPSSTSDIRSNGSSSPIDDLPSFSSFAPQQPILLQPQSSGPPKWIYPLIGVLVVAAGGIGVLAWKVMTAKSPLEPERVVVQVPVPTPVPGPAVAARAPEATKPSTIPDEKLPPREGEAKGEGKVEKSDKAESKGEGKGEGKSDHHHRGKAESKGESKGAESKADAKADSKRMAEDKKAGAQAAALINEKKPAKGSIEDLLNDATPKRSGSSHGGDDDGKKGGGEGASAGPLAKGAVVAGMNGVKPKINDCYNQYKVPGMAMVNVVIGKSGKVTTATVTGKFAGTPTGTCVEKAVKSASFPPSDGLTTPYPFQLK
jgi:predicted Zn finger-like uncharacterized protein